MKTLDLVEHPENPGASQIKAGSATRSERHLKICFLGASFNTGNIGVSMLAAGAIRAAITQFPAAEILFLDYSKSQVHGACRLSGQDVPYRMVNLRFSKKLWLGNHVLVLLALALLLRLIPNKRFHAWLAARNSWLSDLERVDIFASVAGGDSFSDLYGLARLAYVSLPQILALAMGKPLCLLPQTLGPLNGRLAKTIARFIFQRSALIYSRDEQGVADVRAMLNGNDAAKVRFCYDLGFAVTARPPANGALAALFRSNSNPVVGVNVSGLLFQDGNGDFGLQVGYREFVQRLIAMFIEQQGARVVLVPHVFGHAERSESDSPVCQRLYDDLQPKYHDRIGLVERRPYDEMKYLIGECDFFVGSRMHACIAALSQRVPAVSIAYSQKFLGVISSLGLEELVADARSLSEDAILCQIRRAFEGRDVLRAKLIHRLPQVEQTILGLFQGIQDYAADAPDSQVAALSSLSRK